MTTAQRTLEESCFEFGKTWLPSMLDDHGWDCAEAVELTKWTRILAKRSSKLPTHALATNGSPLNEVLFSTHKLRHTAVHRLPTTARGINQLIEFAVKFTETLQDSVRATQLEELQREIESKIKAMELSKNVLEDSMTCELEEIRRQRQELDEKEKHLVANMLKEDQENRSLIGSLLEESIKRIFFEETKAQPVSEEIEDNLEAKTDGLNGMCEVEKNKNEARDLGCNSVSQ